jgi:hypothetical protein
MPKTLTPADRQPVLDSSAFDENARRAHEQFLESPFYRLHEDNLPTEDLPGVYALYYRGALPFYYVWAVLLRILPLYIGKSSTSLRKRLKKHIESILEVQKAVGGLRLEDFEFRILAVPADRGWIAEGLEGWLIKHYDPLWNGHVKGFGNNPQGKERGTTAKAGWDILHPGRDRGENASDTLTFADVLRDVITFAKELLIRYGLTSELERYERAALTALDGPRSSATLLAPASEASPQVQGETYPLFPEEAWSSDVQAPPLSCDVTGPGFSGGGEHLLQFLGAVELIENPKGYHVGRPDGCPHRTEGVA